MKEKQMSLRESKWGHELSMNTERTISVMEDSLRRRERLSPRQIHSVEWFLDRSVVDPYCPQERVRIIREYGLFRISGTQFGGDPDVIYDHLLEKFPSLDRERFHNRDGKGYMRLVYAVLYGNNPIRVVHPARVE